MEADKAAALRISFFCGFYGVRGCSAWVVKCLPIFVNLGVRRVGVSRAG